MLYVFHVNTGRMITLDMSTALDTVNMLKETIEKICGIPKTQQVLLISGGEILQKGTKVCSYSSGTDTNPIFMFSTHKLQDIPVIIPFKDESKFKEMIKQSKQLPVALSTVVSRAQLAHKMYEVAEEETKQCERMVYEQHLQQQGWAAVVANMEDVTKEFKQRFIEFFNCLDEHLDRRPEYLANLASFENDLSVLDKIPISPGLVTAAHQSFSGFGELLGQQESFPASLQDLRSTGNGQEATTDDAQSTSAAAKSDAGNESGSGTSVCISLTLLQWLTGKDDKSTLQDVAMNCSKTIDIFNVASIQHLKNSVDAVINQSRQEGMREIGGVALRFQGLDKLMCNATKLVKEQCKIATAIQHNQNRASDLGDSSILPDLCESHLSQLDVMAANHKELTDYHRRIYTSKEELSNNLVKRIMFLVNLENRMSELDSKMLFYNRSLRRVQRHLAVIEQIHDAPSMYVQAISEVIRRKTFSSCFVKWSSNIVANWSGIYNEEIHRRQDFSSKFEGHFLNGLFTGLDDMPPDYAIQEPHTFDANLPNVTMTDMTALTSIIPEVTAEVALPDLTTVTRFFLSHTNRIIRDLQTTSEPVSSSLEPQPRLTDMLQHLKDPCDSETDTEEFEKVDKLATVSSGEKLTVMTTDTFTSTELTETVNRETLTDESGSTNSDEIERLRGLLREMSNVCLQSFGMLRDGLRNIKEDSTNDRIFLENRFTEIVSTWDKINNETRDQATSKINQMTHNHMTETAALRSQMLGYVKTIEGLCSQMVDQRMINSNLTLEHAEQMATLESSMTELKERMVEMDRQLAAAEANKEQAVNETRESMNRSHKTEIESLRSRFKLMTNMERSPSDTSLEKIDRAECSEAPQFDIEHVQTTQPRAATKMMLAHSPKSPTKSSSDIFRQILFSKDQELDALRQQQQQLEAQNQSLAERLGAMSMPSIELNTVREELNQERSLRRELEESISMSKSRADLTSNSVIISSPNSSSATTSSGRSRGINCRRMVCIDACSKGDNVLVMWNPKHNQYTLYQDNPILYFLHAESHPALHLELPYSSGAPSSTTISNVVVAPPTELETEPQSIQSTTTSVVHPVQCVVGKVVEKEFCYARKDENRYKVQRGTKFYRVKVAPRSNTCADPSSKCCRRMRQDSDPMSSTATPSMSGSTLTPRPLSFVSSFAQTENDASGASPVSADMVDLGVMPMTITEAADEVFLSVPTIMDDDCHMSDASSSLYHTFDEVYEMEDRTVEKKIDESKPDVEASRSSSSASDTAPIVTQIDHSIPYSDCH